ncbi:hypothetical protein [Pyrobaculum ferrireducens]|uniref:Uncharacterized protein n=1 Tax=Pyrobaculum ferrireducens TaxID=1104324 RepID=G7VF41_9CREN|nr:hypothetical protein [Pyrobaculum ferrireducens]AET31657.1 hypothetical protein P186_0196 [Pyrobaculum ferrireducens]
MRRLAYPLFFLLGVAAAYAVLSFLNPVHWRLNATLPPVSKDVNTSLYPLVRGWYTAVDVNATYYYMKFMPGWPEQYVVGLFRARDPGWQARLEAVARAGSPGGTYAISLGGQVQITDVQSGGPYVPTTAPLVWTTTTTSRYSVLARAWFNQGGIYAWQWVNFTAEPMAKLYNQAFSCGVSQYVDNFASYCSWIVEGFDQLPPWAETYTTGGSEVTLDYKRGIPPPSIYTDGKNGYGVVFIDVSQWIGGFPATSSFKIDYMVQAALTGNDYMQLNFFIDTNGDGFPDIEVVWYTSVDGRQPVSLSSVIYGRSLPYVAILNSSKSPPSSTWLTWTINKIYDTGVVVGVAFGMYSPNGDTKGYWDNFAALKCVLPSSVAALTRGADSRVYVDASYSPSTPPSLATEVDAYGSTGVVSNDYGYSVAVYRLPSPVPAAGASISVRGLYVRDAADVQNNAAFLAVGVDTNGDGVADVEYIYYRTDGDAYAIVSSFVNPGSLICTDACVNTTQYRFINLGTMASGSTYTWSITLGDLPGAVVGVALGVADASGYQDGTVDDFWVFWDDLTVTYSACPPPAGWSSLGYVWQSYGCLLATAGGVGYAALVPNALTYVANFTGVGTYAVFDSALNVVFGVYRGASGFSAVCGSALYALGPLPAARYVELRPLGGFGDVIIRDANGNILARYGCSYTTTPTYIGVKTEAGEAIKLYTLEAWG